MLARLLSGDFPRSRALTAVLVAILIALALAPFIFPGTRSLNVAAKVAVFVLLVASYDLLLGYTGIVSFAHTMFFGIGGYGVGIAMAKMGPGWGALALGIAASLALSLGIALAIGSVISFASMVMASQVGETAALRLHATELLLLLGAAIVLVIERPAQPQVASSMTVPDLSLQQAQLPHNR